MRKVDQENSRHRACQRRGALNSRYSNDTGRFRKGSVRFNNADADLHLVTATSAAAVVSVERVAEIVRKGANFKALAGRIAKKLGLTRNERIQAGLSGRIR